MISSIHPISKFYFYNRDFKENILLILFHDSAISALFVILLFPFFRLRELPALVNAILRPTPSANAAVTVPTTSKRRPVPNAVTPLPSSVPSTGASRAREERPPELAVCVISRIWPVVSRMVSVRVPSLNPVPFPLKFKEMTSDLEWRCGD